MRENEPVLLVLSVCDGEIILEKGEILCEKCQALMRRDIHPRPVAKIQAVAIDGNTVNVGRNDRQ